MEWIAHAGLQEGGSLPNSRESILRAQQESFRVEFDVIRQGEDFLLAHSAKEIPEDYLYLEEALSLLSHQNISLDLKSSGNEERLGAILCRFPLEGRLLLCGHDEESLFRVPGNYQRGVSITKEDPRTIEEILLCSRADGIMLEHGRRKEIEKIKDSGRWVHLWTIDNPLDLEGLCDLFPDGITSNRPREMRETWKTISAKDAL